MPAVTKKTSSDTAATIWFKRPLSSRNWRDNALSGTMPRPVSLATNISEEILFGQMCNQAVTRSGNIMPANDQICHPYTQTVDKNDIVRMIKAAKRVHKVYRCLGEHPFTTLGVAYSADQCASAFPRRKSGLWQDRQADRVRCAAFLPAFRHGVISRIGHRQVQS